MALIADVFKCLLIASNGDVIAQDQLSEANINVTVETNDVVAGRNELIAVLSGRREIELSMNTPVFNFEVLAKHIGTDIVTGAGTAYSMPVWKTVTDNVGSLEITLDNEPIADTLKIYADDGTELSGFTISGTTVTISDVAVTAGDSVEVRTYQYATPAGTQAIDIDSTKFPKDVKIVLETLEIGNDEQEMSYLQFEYPRVKPSADFSISTSSTRDANSNDMTYRVMKPANSNVIGTFKRIPIEEVV